MFCISCDFPKFFFVYSKTCSGCINEDIRNLGWRITAFGSDQKVSMNEGACVSDFVTGPGGVQTHFGEKVSEKVSGSTFTNEGRQHVAMLYVTQYCYGCL